MNLLPKPVGRMVNNYLHAKVRHGTMPILSPFKLSLLGRLPRLRRLEAIYWRVAECAIESPVEPCLARIWPHVVAGSSWALPPQSIPWLWNLLLKTQAKNIIEVGSGISTLVFSAYLAAQRRATVAANDGRIVALEHDTQWMEATKRLLTELGCGSGVEFIEAEIVAAVEADADWRLSESTMDALTQATHNEEFDFCLIDGPPAHVFGRGPTLPALLPFLRSGAVILLDDACRKHELDVSNRWHRELRSSVQWLGIAPIGHGFSVFEKR